MRRMIGTTRKSSRAQRSATAIRRRPKAIRAAAVVGLVLVLVAAGWVWSGDRASKAYDGAVVALIDFSAAVGLVTDEVFVLGRDRTSRQALIAALDITLGTPLLAFDTEAARRRIEAIGWVREAIVERRLPDIIFLRIVERQPLALWQRAGILLVIDRDGKVIEGAQPVRFSRLPVIVGDDAPANIGHLLSSLASEPGLSRRVAAAVRVGGRRWNLRFDNGVDVELPEGDISAAWRRLAEFERLHSLLARDIKVIDLRLPDRVVVRPSEDFKKWSAGGENT